MVLSYISKKSGHCAHNRTVHELLLSKFKTMKLHKYTEQNKQLQRNVDDLAVQFENLHHQKTELEDKRNLMNEISSLKDEIAEFKKQSKKAKKQYDDLTIRNATLNDEKSRLIADFDREKRDHEETLVAMRTFRDKNENLNKKIETMRVSEDNFNREIKKTTEKLSDLQAQYKDCSEKLQKQIDEANKQSELKDGAWAIIDDLKKSESAQKKPEVTENESQFIDVSCQTEFSKTPNTIEALDGNSESQVEDTKNEISHERRLSNFTTLYRSSMIQSRCSHHSLESEKSKE